MIEKSLIEKNLANCLSDTSFLGLPNMKRGKVQYRSALDLHSINLELDLWL